MTFLEICVVAEWLLKVGSWRRNYIHIYFLLENNIFFGIVNLVRVYSGAHFNNYLCNENELRLMAERYVTHR